MTEGKNQNVQDEQATTATLRSNGKSVTERAFFAPNREKVFDNANSERSQIPDALIISKDELLQENEINSSDSSGRHSHKASATLRRLFNLYRKEWALEFDFQKCDKFYYPINKTIVHELSKLVARYDPPDSYLMPDANGDPRWISDLCESMEEAIKKSGATKCLLNSMWMDEDTGFVYGIIKQNSMGCLVLWQPNSTDHTFSGITLSGMAPVNPIEARRLFEKTQIGQYRKLIAEYDKKINGGT